MKKNSSAASPRATLADVARAAGVSTATADRVLNGRAGSQARSAQLVLQAAAQLQYRPAEALAAVRSRAPFRLAVLLPAHSQFVRQVGEMFASRQAWAEHFDIQCHSSYFPNFDAAALVARLQELEPHHDGIAVMPFEDPWVRETLRGLAQGGMPIVTLISDIANTGRIGYVGLDNRAVGRSAGYLLGHFVGPGPAQVAVLAASMRYRAHEEREAGFLSQLRENFPQLQVIAHREGMDDSERTYAITRALLEQQPALRAIYNVGSAADGIGRALRDTGRAGQLVFVGHGLAPESRALLLDGSMHALLTQDPRATVLDCLRIFANVRERREPLRNIEPTRCHIVLRDNLP